MADEQQAEQVTATTVEGANSASVNLSMEEGKATAPSNEVTAESLGVAPEQFDKYYKDGQYNWEAHAKELQFKEQQQAKKAPEQQANQPAAAPAEAQEAVENAGLNWDTLGDKIVTDGDIGEADYKALEEIGIPTDIAKEYVEAVKFRTETHVNQVTEFFGGEQQFEAVKTWAQQNYSEAELDALSAQLSDPQSWKLAADMLSTKAGHLPSSNATYGPNAGSAAGTTVQPYGSQQEMIADQRRPEYKRDPSFRAQVVERARVSNFEQNPRAHSGGM